MLGEAFGATLPEHKPRSPQPAPKARAQPATKGPHWKAHAAQPSQRTTVQALIAEGIDAVFARRHKPQIAALTPQHAGNE